MLANTLIILDFETTGLSPTMGDPNYFGRERQAGQSRNYQEVNISCPLELKKQGFGTPIQEGVSGH